ncbi:hypothetical protein [Kordia sp.]|uniref:hypothetical protein n=1 Tax=Kordia sp. TaxID=1965332 RepID=UPI003D6AB3A4
MKKRNLKNLSLNKKSISSLSKLNLNGGAINISEAIGCVTATSCNNQCPVGITDRCISNICLSREGSCYLNCNSVYPDVC